MGSTGKTSPPPTDGPLTFEELQLAARNRGMPLEALAYDIMPSGLHYLLVHFDIPAIDGAAWRLHVGGAVRRPRELTVDELRSMPSVLMPVTMECAGNGRARPRSKPPLWRSCSWPPTTASRRATNTTTRGA